MDERSEKPTARSTPASGAAAGVWGCRLALATLLAYYAVVSLRHLTVVPPVFQDEAWFASVAFKWATDGIFGSDVFAGFYGMERRYYGFPPVAPFLLAVTFRIAGFGLLQMRLAMVVLGALTLVLTYVLGRRLFGCAVGVLAVAFLLLVRTDFVYHDWPTGILFLDVSRFGRYDLPVPVFGLAALIVYLAARDRRADGQSRGAEPLFALSGCLAALSALSHAYGIFWIAALGVLAVWDRAGWRALAALGIAFALPWAAYGVYVLADPAAFVGQTRPYAPRFSLSDPAWYWRNLSQEPFRYAPGLGRLRPAWVLRPGLWLALAAIPASLVALAWRARVDRDARALAVPAALFPALFALLIMVKFRSYKVAFFPLLALAAAWGIWTVWRASGPRRGRRWLQPVVLLFLVAVAVEGLAQAAALERTAAATTPYAAFLSRLRAHVPPGTRVLGLHEYWIGFEDTDYRSWYVPWILMDGRYRTPPLTAAEALDAIAPEVVLIDPAMRALLDGRPSTPGDRRRADIRRWLRDWSLVAVLDDPTYGPVELYRRRSASDPPRRRSTGARIPAT